MLTISWNYKGILNFEPKKKRNQTTHQTNQIKQFLRNQTIHLNVCVQQFSKLSNVVQEKESVLANHKAVVFPAW